jgi:RNA polymerase sigma factor (TIGR02999 family)
MRDVTLLLRAGTQGDTHAAEELLVIVYEELRRLAAQRLAQEPTGQTLQATALVHETYLRLVGGQDESSWESRGHFFAAAAEAMRRILIDRARRRCRRKHGGGLRRHDVNAIDVPASESSWDLIALDAALEKLAARDAAKAELVKLRFFAGLTVEQAAQSLGISTSTADRHWAYARAWLYRELGGQRPHSPD